MMGSKRVVHWTSETRYECSEIAGSPQGTPSSRRCRLWSRKEDLQRAWNRYRRAVWDQVGLSHCWHNGLVTVRDETRLRRGHNDQSRQGHHYGKRRWQLWQHWFISIHKTAYIASNCTLYTNKIGGATVRPLQKRGETGLHTNLVFFKETIFVD